MELGFKTNYDFKNPSVLIIFFNIPRDYNLQEEYIPKLQVHCIGSEFLLLME